MFVCMSRISLTDEPIRFSFTLYLFIGPGNVHNYFGGVYHHQHKINRSFNRNAPPPPSSNDLPWGIDLPASPQIRREIKLFSNGGDLKLREKQSV